MTTTVLTSQAQFDQAVSTSRLYIYKDGHTTGVQCGEQYSEDTGMVNSVPCYCHIDHIAYPESFKHSCPFTFAWTQDGKTKTIHMCYNHMKVYRELRSFDSYEAISQIQKSISTVALSSKYIVNEIDRAGVVRMMESIKDEVKAEQ